MSRSLHVAEDEVAGEDALFLGEGHVHRRLPTALGCPVDHVVVDEAGGVDHLGD